MSNPINHPCPLEISVADVKRLIDAGEEFLLIDCREQDEYDHCRIEGSKLIPMNETPNRLTEIEASRDQRVVVHCHHGGRSLNVTKYLRQQGFESAQNMTGGIDVWSQEVDSSVARY